MDQGEEPGFDVEVNEGQDPTEIEVDETLQFFQSETPPEEEVEGTLQFFNEQVD